MTAVAPPPTSLQSNHRSGWSGPNMNGASNGLNAMSADDMASIMFMPRKPAPRTNSSSSLSSLASSTSTASTVSSSSTNKSNGVNGTAAGDWASRPGKRTTRGMWQPSKSEPIAGLSTARPQSVNSATSGPSAASAISALHNPNGMSHQGSQPDTQQNGSIAMNKSRQSEPTAVLYLTPMNGTFERKTINVPFYPDVLRIGRQTNNKTMPTPANGYFDSKVLSRQHAEIWADRNGKIWIRDVKSSNGTFVNGQRLSQENKDSDPHELREQDMLELGIDIVSEDQKTVVHHKVAARVEHAGFYEANSVLDLNFGDLDSSSTNALMGGNLGQALGQMRRSTSQSSLNSNSRMSVGSAASNTANMQQRAPHFWLAPVNMDKIIQRLNAECKAAKQQSLDLQRAQQQIDAILAENQSAKKESSQKSSPIEKIKGKESFRGRFTDPPAPPPQAPLPEKPDVALQRVSSGIGAAVAGFTPSLLTRSDTARPQLSSLAKSAASSPTDAVANATQLASLMDQLNKARQEVESERARLRDIENQLVQERVMRENAEERAKRLESQRLQVQTSQANSEEAPTPIEDEQMLATKEDQPESSKLQERFDLLLAEFNEYKLAAETWRVEKEQAEKERDEERKQRISLKEMIENIRSEEAQYASRRKSRGRRRSRSKSTEDAAVSTGNSGEEYQTEKSEADTPSPLTNGTRDANVEKVENGHPVVAQKHYKGSDTSDIHALLQRGMPLTTEAAAPYISAISVVMLGVAVMAILNKMGRGDGPTT